ncbi:MAG: hypothetical protein ACRET4_18335 [Steroidobacteraceae bacterium]
MATPKLSPSDVFINLPFDSDYESLFLAMISGLVSLGLNPRSVVQISGSADRLRRLVAIIQECPFSIHDMSRVQRSGEGAFRVPRFNMPFEMGLAAAVSITGTGMVRQWRVIEAVRHRVAHSCSDVDGYNAEIHGGTVRGMFEALSNIFPDTPMSPVTGVDDMLWVYRRLRRFRQTLPANIYAASPFRRLVLTATALAAKRSTAQR